MAVRIPSIEMRIIQYKRNKQTLTSLETIEKKSYDWIVTTAFYSALHLVEKHLPAPTNKKEVRKHDGRRELVVNEAKLGQIVADAYQALFNASMAARYDCLPIDGRRANEALTNLKIIEDNLP